MKTKKQEKIDSFCELWDMTEVTTDRQRKNGTIQLKDNILPWVFYTLHKNGYIRRKIQYLRNPHSYDNYQLNRTKIKHHPEFHMCTFTERIMIKNLDAQLIQIMNPIVSYRIKNIPKRNRIARSFR